jgi:hypothetical protein
MASPCTHLAYVSRSSNVKGESGKSSYSQSPWNELDASFRGACAPHGFQHGFETVALNLLLGVVLIK